MQYIIIPIIMLFALPGISHRHLMPGSFALAILFPATIAWSATAGLSVSMDIIYLAGAIVCILTVSAILSPRPDIAFRHLILYCGAISIGLLSAGYDVWMAIIACGCIHSVALFTPWRRGLWLCGNSNFAGAILAPCFFIAIHAGYWPGAVLLAAGKLKSDCRGAMAGVVIGSAMINPIALLVSICAVSASFFLTMPGNFQPLASLIIRFKMWKCALRSMTLKQFIVGTGQDVGKIAFMKNRNITFRMRRLHSDIVQGLFDGGVFYVAIYLFIGAVSISIAPSAMAAALKALMVAGLFIDTQLMPITSVLFWMIVGQINMGGQVVVSPWVFPVSVVLLVLSVATWGRAFVADIYHGIGSASQLLSSDGMIFDYRPWGGKRIDPVAMAHKINPNDSIITASHVGWLILAKQYGPAFDKSWSLVNRYDGDLSPEVPYFLLALSAVNIGSKPIAKIMAERTLMYCEHEGARRLLELLKEGEDAK